MNSYSVRAFSDELGSIVKHAQEDDSPDERSVLHRIKESLGPGAVNLGLGLFQDISSGRDVGSDLGELAEKFRSPSKFTKDLGESANMYFLGGARKGSPSPKIMSRALPFIGNTLLPLTALPSVVKKKDDSGLGRSRLARASELAGNVAGGLLGARMGGTAAAITGMAGGALGKGLGAGIDYLTGYRPDDE